MKRFTGFSVAALAVAFALVVAFAPSPMSGPPAMAQSTLAAPANQDAQNTRTAGEVVVTWDPVDGARGYRVGWLNHDDYQEARGEWLQRFTFAQVPRAVSRYVVTRLTGGQEYWFIVASVDGRGQVSWPTGWIAKFRVTGLPAPTADCPQPSHGGIGTFCPITGLRLGERHLEKGGTARWGLFNFTLDDAEVIPPGEHQFFGDSYRGVIQDPYTLPDIAGRRYLRLKVTMDNNGSDIYLYPGREYTLDTDAGVAFVHSGERISREGVPNKTDLIFDIPERAKVAVLAIRPVYSVSNADFNKPRLFRIPVE